MCVSVCYHVFCHHLQQAGQREIPKGSALHLLVFKKHCIFDSYRAKKTSKQVKNMEINEVLHVSCVLLWSSSILICMIPSLFLPPPLLLANISQLCSVEVRSATHRPSTWGFLCSCNDVRMMSCHYVHLNQAEIVVCHFGKWCHGIILSGIEFVRMCYVFQK